MSGQRIVIVDYNHQLHQFLNSKAPRFFWTIKLGAQPIQIETTVPAYTIKNMHKFARKGIDTLAVCFDSPCTFRKDYFRQKKDGTPTDIEYKGARKPMIKDMVDGSNLTIDILDKAKVPIYKIQGYEADDLIYSLVMICKELYPTTPIDIVTNDGDLLPLVDSQVSVFLRSTKFTWAVSKDIEKTHYWQVTPENYEQVVGGLSRYQKFSMPYNTILLHKLLRGDDSDGIPGKIDLSRGKQDFPPKMYNELIEIFESRNINLAEIFRYVKFYPRYEHNNMPTGKLGEIYKKKMDEQIRVMTEVFMDIVDDYDYLAEHIDFIYRGMSPRFVNLVPPMKYDAGSLKVEAERLGINLPI